MSFLFESSQFEHEHDRQEVVEAFADMFQQLEEVEAVEVKAEPLEKALKKLKVSGFTLVPEVSSCVARFDGADSWRSAETALSTDAAMIALAELGWVKFNLGDVGMTGEEDDFRLRFVELTDAEPENKSNQGSEKDLEDLLKAAREFATTAPTSNQPPLRVPPAKRAAIHAKPGDKARPAKGAK